MSVEQPTVIKLPPTRWTTDYVTYPDPDYATRSFVSDLPTATSEFGVKVKNIYKKGKYPFVSEKIGNYPSKTQIRKRLAKAGRKNPAPADASKTVVINKPLPRKPKKKSKKTKK